MLRSGSLPLVVHVVALAECLRVGVARMPIFVQGSRRIQRNPGFAQDGSDLHALSMTWKAIVAQLRYAWRQHGPQILHVRGAFHCHFLHLNTNPFGRGTPLGMRNQPARHAQGGLAQECMNVRQLGAQPIVPQSREIRIQTLRTNHAQLPQPRLHPCGSTRQVHQTTGVQGKPCQ